MRERNREIERARERERERERERQGGVYRAKGDHRDAHVKRLERGGGARVGERVQRDVLRLNISIFVLIFLFIHFVFWRGFE